MHVFTSHWFSGLACREDFVFSRQTLLRDFAGWRVFCFVSSLGFDALPPRTRTSAKLQSFATRSNFFVVRFEFHALVDAFAHFNRDAFVVFVQSLTNWTTATFHALQFARSLVLEVGTCSRTSFAALLEDLTDGTLDSCERRKFKSAKSNCKVTYRIPEPCDAIQGLFLGGRTLQRMTQISDRSIGWHLLCRRKHRKDSFHRIRQSRQTSDSLRKFPSAALHKFWLLWLYSPR